MRNFILTVLDGLRHDVPNFDYLKKSCSTEVSLDRELSSLESLWSTGTSITSWHTTHLKPEPALASLLTGLYPREHGIYSSEAHMNKNFITLADYFSTHGYRTILMNGHESYYRNGIAGKFDETIMGPPQRLFTRLKEVNNSGKPVFTVYEPLDLREPYLLSKFPSNRIYHDSAIQEANNLADTLGYDKKFDRQDAHLMTSDWEIPQAATSKLPVWSFLIDFVHHHHQLEENILNDPINHLLRYYLNTLELISQNHFKTFRTFLEEDEAGERTVMFLTSNSSHGYTERDGVQSFGQQSKPTQDASRVPALFLNTENDPAGDRELTSHVDLMPTVLDEFGIDFDEQLSGQSLYVESSVHDRIFVESSFSFASDEENEVSEQNEQNFVERPVLSWSSLVNSDGWKLYLRGLPITEEDLDLPLKEFFWTIMAKITVTSPDLEQLEQRVENFRNQDRLETRKELLKRLKENSDPKFELYDWKQDYFETENKFQVAPDTQISDVIDELVQELKKRFEDPYKKIQDFEVNEREPVEIDLLPPMKAVGYLE